METHSKQFNGTWTPASVHDLFEDGIIDAHEVMLLSTIASMSTPQMGCYASNNFLAERVRVGRRWIIRVINKLVNRGLLIRHIIDDRHRQLWPQWAPPSRVVACTPLSPRLGSGLQATGVVACTPPENTERENKHNTGGIIYLAEEQDMVGFGIAEPDYSNRVTPSQADTTRAKTLLNAIREKRRVNGPRSIKDWAQCFRLLLQQDGVTEDRIDKALNWYCANMLGEYVPVAHDAATFRKKFIAIEAAMARGTPAHANIEVSDAARQIMNDLGGLRWPAGSKEEEYGPAVQISFDNYTAMMKAIRAIGQTTDERDTRDIVAYTCRKLWDMMPSARGFVAAWWLDVHKMAHGWGNEHWNGKLLAKAFRPEHKAAQKIMNDMVNEWGVAGSWPKILERLKQDAN